MGGPIQATIFKVELNPQAYMSRPKKYDLKNLEIL